MGVRVRSGRMAVVILGAVALSGCYTYRTVESPAIGTAVRVNIPVTVSSALTSGTSTESVAIEGVVLGVGDTLSLATQTRRSMGAYRDLVQFDTLRLAQDQRTSIQLKEFSSSRSAILGLVIAGAAGTAAAVAFGFGGGESGDTPPGPVGPETAVVSSGMISTVLRILRR